MPDTPKDSRAELRKKISMYVAGLASSGKNFVVAGQDMPVSQEVQGDYVNSLVRLFDAYVAEQVAAAELDLLQQLITQGRTATLIGKYPTGEDKHSYDLDNVKIGEIVRLWFLERVAKSKEEQLTLPPDRDKEDK